MNNKIKKKCHCGQMFYLIGFINYLFEAISKYAIYIANGGNDQFSLI